MRGCAGDSGGDKAGSSNCADDNTCDKGTSFQTFSSDFLNQQYS